MKSSKNARRRFRRKQWLLWRDRKNRVRRGNRSHGFICLRPHTLLTLNEFTKKSVSTVDKRLVLELPERLDFEENYESTSSHLHTVRSAARSKTRLKYLSFHKLKHISPSAALVLASEVDRWNQRVGGRLRADTDSWDKDIERLLSQMGYFELLGLIRPTMTEQKATTFLRFQRGDVEHRDAGQLARQLRVEIEVLTGFRIKKQLLFEGLSEAITNVCQHAYPEGPGYPVKQWWLSGSYNRDDGRLCVTFYDQGAGIPETLPRSKIFEIIKATFGQWSDSQKIEAAMEVGRSSTGDEERGKGLQNFVRFASSYPDGRLSIYSLRGMFRMAWMLENGVETKKTQRSDFQNSVGGTLIEWSVRLTQ